MATRGRKPKAKPTNKPGKCPSPPSWLTARGRREWRRLATTLNKLGLLEVLDRDLLALYCDAYDGFLTARAAIAEDGPLQSIDRYNKEGEWLGEYHQASPWVAIAKQNSKAMLDLMQQMGLTPAARTRLIGSTSCEPPKVGAKSPLQQLIERQGGRAAKN